MPSRAPWAAHFGLARTPFGKAIAARDLFARQAHAEAIARISFCVVEQTLGVVSGDVGAGKTVAVRAAVAALDPTRHQVIYIPNPAFGSRGLYVSVVRALGAEDWGYLEPYFDGTITFVEWPEHAGAWLPPTRAAVALADIDESRREVRIDCDDDPRL